MAIVSIGPLKTLTYFRGSTSSVAPDSVLRTYLGMVLILYVARSARCRRGDDMIRVAHRVGASLRQLAVVSGLNRKTVTAIVESEIST
jgi:hypothetical protein